MSETAKPGTLPTGSVAAQLNGKPPVDAPAVAAFEAATTTGETSRTDERDAGTDASALAPEPADLARFEMIKGATRSSELSRDLDPSL